MFMERKLLFVSMLSLLGILACTSNKFWQKIQSAFESGRESALIKEFTDFEWDTVCILGPYSIQSHNREERIAKLIPADVGEFKDKIPNFDSDGKWAFAFIKGGKMIALEHKGRGYYLRDGNAKTACLASTEATLAVDKKMENYLLINRE